MSNRIKTRLAGMSGALLALAALPVRADVDLLQPFAAANRNPFVQIYGLPEAESATIQSPGRFSTDLILTAASNFAGDTKGNETIFLDGETHRAELRLRWGAAEALELGVNVPYLKQVAGGLDGFINDWHRTFGLPDGGRRQYPDNRLHFSYSYAGQQRVDIHEAGQGFGDVSVTAAYRLSQSPTRQLSLRSQLKLPTGEADRLLGSGSTDLAVALHGSDRTWFEQYGIELHGDLGLLWMGRGKVLNELRRDWVAYGSSTLAWLYNDRVSFKVQLDAHTAFYNSALTELGSDSAQLSLGGAVRIADNWAVDMAVSEDVVVDTAPDVVFLVGIKRSAF